MHFLRKGIINVVIWFTMQKKIHCCTVVYEGTHHIIEKQKLTWEEPIIWNFCMINNASVNHLYFRWNNMSVSKFFVRLKVAVLLRWRKGILGFARDRRSQTLNLEKTQNIWSAKLIKTHQQSPWLLINKEDLSCIGMATCIKPNVSIVTHWKVIHHSITSILIQK